jgi:hypothetical protein
MRPAYTLKMENILRITRILSGYLTWRRELRKIKLGALNGVKWLPPELPPVVAGLNLTGDG